MTLVWILLGALTLVALVVALVRTVARDGHGSSYPRSASSAAPPRDAYGRFPSGPTRLG
ncbi:hypothetical protein ACTHAM_003107 [Cellulomonas soli]|uniref:hypothetical protein n=1 Tax=Cellulomonas soli TaxID=931535 RepID=UPI003F85FDA9